MRTGTYADRVWRSQGRVAEWLCRGLQILVGRFNSDPGLHAPEPPPPPLPASRIPVAPGIRLRFANGQDATQRLLGVSPDCRVKGIAVATEEAKHQRLLFLN